MGREGVLAWQLKWWIKDFSNLHWLVFCCFVGFLSLNPDGGGFVLHACILFACFPREAIMIDYDEICVSNFSRIRFKGIACFHARPRAILKPIDHFSMQRVCKTVRSWQLEKIKIVEYFSVDNSYSTGRKTTPVLEKENVEVRDSDIRSYSIASTMWMYWLVCCGFVT